MPCRCRMTWSHVHNLAVSSLAVGWARAISLVLFGMGQFLITVEKMGEIDDVRGRQTAHGVSGTLHIEPIPLNKNPAPFRDIILGKRFNE